MRETPKAAHAFEVYWSLGNDRTLAKVGQSLGKSTVLIEHWSAAHGWVERVKRRQAELSAEADRKRQARIEAFEDVLAAEGATLYGEALDFLRGQLARKKLSVPAVMLLERARSDALRGLRQPETVTRTETTGANGGPLQTEQKHEFDFDAYRRLYPELETATIDGPLAGDHPR